MSSLVLSREHLLFLWHSGPMPAYAGESTSLDYLDMDLRFAFRPGFILAPQLHGIPDAISQGWIERGILEKRFVADLVLGPNPLDIGLANVTLYSDSGRSVLVVERDPRWLAYEEQHYSSCIDYYRVDRSELLKCLPQYWGLGTDLSPAPPGGVCVGSRDSKTQVVVLYCAEENMLNQLKLMKESLDAEQLIVILMEHPMIRSYEIALLEKRRIVLELAEDILNDEGKPQWELSELETMNSRLAETPWSIDPGNKVISFAGNPCDLKDKMFGFLFTLLKYYPRAVSFSRFEKEVWPDVVVIPSTISKCKSDVCRALGSPASDWIQSKYGVGYVLKWPE